MAVTQPPAGTSRPQLIAVLALVFALRMFGLFLLLPVFVIYGMALKDATPALIGTAIGIYGLTQALLQIPLGMLSDRYGRRPLILVGLLLFVAGGVVAALSEHILGVILGRAIQGAGAISSVIMALVGDVVSEQRRTRAMAVLGMSIGGAFVLAMVLGPLLASQLGLSGLFWVSSGLGVLALLLVWLTVPKGAPAGAMLTGAGHWRQLGGNSELWRLAAGIFVLHLLMTALFVVLPARLASIPALAVAAHSWVYLGVMLVSFVLMVPLILLSERHAPRRAMLIAIALLALACAALLAPVAGLPWLLAVLVVFFAGFNALEAMLPSLASRTVSAALRGRAMGLYSSCQFLGVFVGAQLAGLLGGASGSSALLLVMLVLLLVWAVLVLAMTSSAPPAKAPLAELAEQP